MEIYTKVWTRLTLEYLHIFYQVENTLTGLDPKLEFNIHKLQFHQLAY